MTRRVRILARLLAVLLGYLVALRFAQWDHHVPGYGYSQPGDDPLAVIVWIAVALVLWRVGDILTK